MTEAEARAYAANVTALLASSSRTTREVVDALVAALDKAQAERDAAYGRIAKPVTN